MNWLIKRDIMMAEIPLMFEGIDSNTDFYRSEAILQSLDKVNSILKSDPVPGETPYEYMQFSEFLFKTITRPYRMMWKYKTIPLTPRTGYSLLPHVVEEAVQDNLEFFKTLLRTEG